MYERLRHAVDHSSMTQSALAAAMGVSNNYISATLAKSRKNPDFRPDLDSLRKLSRAARVSLRWLETGEGDPDDVHLEELGAERPKEPVRVTAKGSRAAGAVTLQRNDYPVHILAILEAFRRSDVAPEDAYAAIVAASEGRAMLPKEHEAAVAAMDRLLRAARRLRQEGQEVTMESLAWVVLRNGSESH